MFAPRKTEPERQHAAPASSLRERRQAPAPDQPGQARMMQAPPTPVVRNQFNASVGGGRSHIHHDNDGFSHQEPECSPPTRQQRPIRRRKWGFGSTRSPVTACRRRVTSLMLQFPPTFHIRAVETSCNTQPGPHLVTPHMKARPIPARHCTARGHLSDKTQSKDSNSNEPIVIALEFTHEPRSQGQRRSLHPQRR